MRTRVLAGLASVALLAAGCGDGGGPGPGPSTGVTTPVTPSVIADYLVDLLPGDEVLERAEERYEALRSFRARAVGTFGDQTSEVEVVVVGDSAHGTEIARQGTQEVTVEYIRRGDDVWIMASFYFWQRYVPSDIIYEFVGNWVLCDPSVHSYADFGGREPLPRPQGRVTRSGPDSVDGTAVELFTDEAGSTWAIARDDLTLLRFDGSQPTPFGPAHVVMEFTQINSVTEAIAPPGGTVYVLSDYIAVVPA